MEKYGRFADPAWFGVVDGMAHYDWADGNSDADLQNDGIPTRPQDDTRRDAMLVLDTWLDSVPLDNETATSALVARDFPNVSETL